LGIWASGGGVSVGSVVASLGCSSGSEVLGEGVGVGRVRKLAFVRARIVL